MADETVFQNCLCNIILGDSISGEEFQCDDSSVSAFQDPLGGGEQGLFVEDEVFLPPRSVS